MREKECTVKKSEVFENMRKTDIVLWFLYSPEIRFQ